MSLFGMDSLIYGDKDKENSDLQLYNQNKELELEEAQRTEEISLQLAEIESSKRLDHPVVKNTAVIDGSMKPKSVSGSDVIKRQKQQQAKIQQTQTGSLEKDAFIKNFPRTLMHMIRNMVPEAGSNLEALTIFVYGFRDPNYPLDMTQISESCVDKAARCDIFKDKESINDSLRRIEKEMKGLGISGEATYFAAMLALMARLDKLPDEIFQYASDADMNLLPSNAQAFSEALMVAYKAFKNDLLYNNNRKYIK